MDAFRLAWLHLSRKLVPTLMVVTCLAISIGCSGILLRLYNLSSSRFSALAPGGDAIVGAKASSISILLGSLNLEGEYPGYVPYNLFESLRRMQTVAFEDNAVSKPVYIDAVIPVLYFAHVGEFRVLGTDESFMHRPKATDNPLLESGTWFQKPGEVIIGHEVARRLSAHVGSVLAAHPWTAGIRVDAKEEEFPLTVAGIFASQETSNDRAIFASTVDAQEVIAIGQRRHPGANGADGIWGNHVLNYFLVYLKPGGMEKLIQLVDQRTVAQVVPVVKETAALRELTGTGRQLGLFMTGLILALSWLAVASMMLTRFDAMYLQIAVLRAIGYSKGSIRNWLIWEGVLLGASACAIGAGFDGLVFPWIRAQLGSSLPLEIASPIYMSSPVWICAFGATILAVFLPLFMIFRRDVHGALRGT